MQGLTVVDGLGPDAQVGVNERGGKQSVVPYRLDLLPPHATLAVGAVLKYGADKYGEDNWHAISTREHLAHMLAHVFAWLAHDKSDEHLEHAACRALMALEIEKRGGPDDHNGAGGLGEDPRLCRREPPPVAEAACHVETPDFKEAA